MFLSVLYYRYWMECYIISTDLFIKPLLSAVWIMLPAYLPNPVAALSGGGMPVDFGRNYPDGRRIFGDGKTWRGLIVGILAGAGIGIIQMWAAGAYGLGFLPRLTFLSVGLLASGALLGDLVKSFFKRRFGKDRGTKWPVADQYDLVAGAFLLLLVFDSAWLFGEVTIPVFIVILILTPILHRAVNIIGFAIKVKEVPW
jgi:CDP-2,3-bis-(O-geranylgeranyl)-sn-glycerol synthase